MNRDGLGEQEPQRIIFPVSSPLRGTSKHKIPIKSADRVNSMRAPEALLVSVTLDIVFLRNDVTAAFIGILC